MEEKIEKMINRINENIKSFYKYDSVKDRDLYLKSYAKILARLEMLEIVTEKTYDFNKSGVYEVK